MNIVICGHRGVGKTTLLQRLRSQERFGSYEFVDLDQKIEEITRLTVHEIFEKEGEVRFRQLEREIFLSIQGKNPAIVTVGGGFDVSQLSEQDILILVQRESDSAGRVFLNRPRLISHLSALDESRTVYYQRQERFLLRADFIYPMLEGMEVAGDRLLQLESDLFDKLFSFIRGESPTAALNSSAIITLEADLFRRPWRLRLFLAWSQCLGFKIELRDDLLSMQQIEEIREQVEPQFLIYAFRKSSSTDLPLSQFAGVDWALELGAVPEKLKTLTNLIVSNHQNDPQENLSELLAQAPMRCILKSSPLISHFSELDHLRNSGINFLPRSLNGRWKWFRLLNSSRQQLNYYRYWQGSAADQASLFEMLAFTKAPAEFAAVLGDPIRFSYSPVFHDEFFHKMQGYMLPIQVQEEEWSEAFAFLQKNGLKYAAVTAPLKKLLFQDVAKKSSLALNLHTANTYSKDYCDNTDLAGFRALIEGMDLQSCVVWGGGGTLEMVRRVLPQANYVAVRGEKSDNLRPEVLIWAAPRKEPMIFPPDSWTPKIVIDLNYGSNSPGIEYAAKVQAQYVSGLKMFIRQAQEQQLVWSEI